MPGITVEADSIRELSRLLNAIKIRAPRDPGPEVAPVKSAARRCLAVKRRRVGQSWVPTVVGAAGAAVGGAVGGTVGWVQGGFKRGDDKRSPQQASPGSGASPAKQSPAKDAQADDAQGDLLVCGGGAQSRESQGERGREAGAGGPQDTNCTRNPDWCTANMAEIEICSMDSW